MNGTCFVTGGSGFVGGRLIKRLVAQGWQVKALVRNDEGVRIVQDLGAEPVRGTLLDESYLASALRGSDIVVHVAALFKLWGSEEEFEEANVRGTDLLLKAAQAAGVNRILCVKVFKNLSSLSWIHMLGCHKPSPHAQNLFPVHAE
jgi:nucleoside-diphosphate-sugar epimerase